MGKEPKNETAPEQREDLPRWQEIRRKRLEDKRKGKEHLDLKISEYIKILEFGKNVEEESGGTEPEDANGNA